AGQRLAEGPGSKPRPGRLQREQVNPDAVADVLTRSIHRLPEVGRVDGNLMAAPGQRTRHLEARLGRPAAGWRQIADDVEDAQDPLSMACDEPAALFFGPPGQAIADEGRCRQRRAGVM